MPKPIPKRKNKDNKLKGMDTINLGGRPPSYQSITHDELGRRLALLNIPDTEIAAVFGIDHVELVNWQHRYPSLKESISEGREKADGQVVNALHQRAIGFKYKEEVVNKQGDVVELTKYAIPDTQACIAWLSKRHKQWKDKAPDTNIQLSIAQQADSINQLFGLNTPLLDQKSEDKQDHKS
jgi:hypothetical protein